MSQKVKIRLPTQKSLKKNKTCQKSTDITRVDGTLGGQVGTYWYIGNDRWVRKLPTTEGRYRYLRPVCRYRYLRPVGTVGT